MTATVTEQTAKTLMPHRRFMAGLVLCVLSVDVFVIGLAGYWLHHSRQQHEERAAIATQNLARSLELTMDNIFDKTDVALLAVVDEAQRELAKGNIEEKEITSYIRRQKSRVPELENMRLTDAQGETLYGTNIPSDTPINVSDRDYFVNVQKGSQEEPFLGKPVVGRFTNKFVFNMSRRVNHPDGTFAGVVFATLPIDHFVKLFSSLDMGKNGVITLRSVDLSVIARYPEPRGTGSSVGVTAMSPELQHLIQSGHNTATYRATSTIDGLFRTFSFRKVTHYPLYIIAGRASRDYFAPWRIEVMGMLTLLSLFIVVSTAATIVIQRNRRREVQAQEELVAHRNHLELLVRERTAELSRTNNQLNVAQRIASIGSWEHDHLSGQLLWSKEIFCIFEVAETAEPSYGIFLTAVHPDDRKLVEMTYQDSLRSGTPYAVTHRLLLPGGRVKYVHQQCETSYDEAGTPLCSVGTVQDITARKKVEDDLRESEERFRSLIQSVPVGLFVQIDDRFVYINPEALRLFGAESTDQLIGHHIVERLHPDYRDIGHKRLHTLNVERQSVPRNEEICLKLDGTPFFMEASSAPVTYGGQNGSIVYFTDISERKRWEEKLIEYSERLQLAITSAHLGIWDWNIQNNAMIWDDRMLQLYGMNRDQFTGSVDAWMDNVHPEDRDRIMAEYQAALKEEADFNTEFRVVLSDGTEKHIKADGTVIRDAAGTAQRMIGVNRDITETKKLTQQLIHAQKMEAIGQIAGGVAHDFNNILTVIMGNCTLIRMSFKNIPNLDSYVDQILSSAERATYLTRGLLTFCRKEATQKSHRDLNEIVNNIYKFLVRIIGEDIEFTLACHHSPLKVNVDQNQIEQILMNLATNARDAMQKGGSLRITTEPCMLDTAFVEAHGGNGPPGLYAVMSVSDTGCGMAAEACKRIFEAFYTTKETGKGTGLGMAIVSGIVSQHDGIITVTSTPGEGTTFAVYLPQIEQNEPPEAKVPAPVLPRGGDETILVIEDNESVRRTVDMILKEAGYDVILAINGQDGIDQFIANRDRIKLVYLDVIMPGMNGKEAAEKIRLADPCVKVLFTSGYPADIIESRGGISSDLEILRKPFKEFDLLTRVRGVLDGAYGKTMTCS